MNKITLERFKLALADMAISVADTEMNMERTPQLGLHNSESMASMLMAKVSAETLRQHLAALLGGKRQENAIVSVARQVIESRPNAFPSDWSHDIRAHQVFCNLIARFVSCGDGSVETFGDVVQAEGRGKVCSNCGQGYESCDKSEECDYE